MSLFYFNAPTRNERALLLKSAYDSAVARRSLSDKQTDELVVSSIFIAPKKTIEILSYYENKDYRGIAELISSYKINESDDFAPAGFILSPTIDVENELNNEKISLDLSEFSNLLWELGIANEANGIGKKSAFYGDKKVLQISYEKEFSDLLKAREYIKEDLANIRHYVEEIQSRKIGSSKLNKTDLEKYLMELKQRDQPLARRTRIFLLSIGLLDNATQLERFLLASYGFTSGKIGMAYEEYLKEMINYFPENVLDFLSMTRSSLQEYALKRAGAWANSGRSGTVWSFFSPVEDDFTVTLSNLVKVEGGDVVDAVNASLENLHNLLPGGSARISSFFRRIEELLIGMGFADKRMESVERIREAENLQKRGLEIAKGVKCDGRVSNFGQTARINASVEKFKNFLTKHYHGGNLQNLLLSDEKICEIARGALSGPEKFKVIPTDHAYVAYQYRELSEKGENRDLKSKMKELGWNVDSPAFEELVTRDRLVNTLLYAENKSLAAGDETINLEKAQEMGLVLTDREIKIYAIENYPENLLDIVKQKPSQVLMFLIDAKKPKGSKMTSGNFIDLVKSEYRKFKEEGLDDEADSLLGFLKSLKVEIEEIDQERRVLKEKVRLRLKAGFYKDKNEATNEDLYKFLLEYCPSSFVEAIDKGPEQLARACFNNEIELLSKIEVYKIIARKLSTYETEQLANQKREIENFLKKVGFPVPPRSKEDLQFITLVTDETENLTDAVPDDALRHIILMVAPNRILEVINADRKTLQLEGLTAYGVNGSIPVKEIIARQNHAKAFGEAIRQSKHSNAKKRALYAELVRLQALAKIPADLEKRFSDGAGKSSQGLRLRTNTEVMSDVKRASSRGTGQQLFYTPSSQRAGARAMDYDGDFFPTTKGRGGSTASRKKTIPRAPVIRTERSTSPRSVGRPSTKRATQIAKKPVKSRAKTTRR